VSIPLCYGKPLLRPVIPVPATLAVAQVSTSLPQTGTGIRGIHVAGRPIEPPCGGVVGVCGFSPRIEPATPGASSDVRRR
jgi:hypothetical protein